MKRFSFKSDESLRSSNPGNSWFLVFFKNSFKKRIVKFSILDPSRVISPVVESYKLPSWAAASVVLKLSSPL